MLIALIIIISFCIVGVIFTVLGPCLGLYCKRKPFKFSTLRRKQTTGSSEAARGAASNAVGKIPNRPSRGQPQSDTEYLLDLFLYVYGLALIEPRSFSEYPQLYALNPEKIFELCYVATAYAFFACNPKYLQMALQPEQSIRFLQMDKDAVTDSKQLSAFMLIHYNAKVLNDIVAARHCTKNAAIVQGVTNWLLLQLLGNHRSSEVITPTVRISKLLLALTFDDIVTKQLNLLARMKNEGFSLSEIKMFFVEKHIITFLES